MGKLFLKAMLLMLVGINSLNAQVESDSIKLNNNNCATKLARDYMFSTGRIKSKDYKQTPLRSSELLKGTEFEKETNGVFIISSLITHRRKFIVLKKDSQIKLLTFNDVKKSLIELISFLDDINSSDEELVSYIDLIQEYIKNSKKSNISKMDNKIKTDNKKDNSDWVKCQLLNYNEEK